MKMRGCPSWNTSSTAVMAITAPKEKTPAQPEPAGGLQRQRQRVAATPSSVDGTMPVSTAATAM